MSGSEGPTAPLGAPAAIHQGTCGSPERIRRNFSRILEGRSPEGQRSMLLAGAPHAARGDSAGLRPRSFDPWAPEPQLDLLRMFPALFSLSCCAIFLAPIWLAVHLSYDQDIRYWGPGRACAIAGLLPLLFVAAFLVHVALRRPHKVTVLATLLIPSMTFLAVGNSLLAVATDKAHQLVASDCDAFPGKRQLEHSWQAAHTLYSDCLRETLPGRNLTMEQAVELFRVQDCTEYAAARETHKEWDYLWYLEEEHRCAGWCSFRGALWTSPPVMDSCSVVVSQVLRVKARRSGGQLLVYAVGVLVLSSLSALVVGPRLPALGFGQ